MALAEAVRLARDNYKRILVSCESTTTIRISIRISTRFVLLGSVKIQLKKCSF